MCPYHPNKVSGNIREQSWKKLRAEDKEECNEILSSKNGGACAIINSLL